MNDEMKSVVQEYITKSFREGGEAAMDACIEAIEISSANGVKTMRAEDVLEFLVGMKKMIAARQGMPLGAIKP